MKKSPSIEKLESSGNKEDNLSAVKRSPDQHTDEPIETCTEDQSASVKRPEKSLVINSPVQF